MGRLFVILTFTSVDKIISWCYHSNEFILQNYCMLLFISWDFTQRNINFYGELVFWPLLREKRMKNVHAKQQQKFRNLFMSWG